MDFSAAASGWDTERRIRRAGIIAGEIARSLDINERLDAMEFGCGTGLVSFNLSDSFRHITLVDSSEGMIKALEKKISEAGIGNMMAVLSDISNMLGYSSEKLCKQVYDVIYTSMAMHHIKDIETLLDIFYKLLKPGGYLCIVDLDKEDGSFHRLEEGFDGHNGFDQAELSSMLDCSGFKNVVSRTFLSDTKLIGNDEVTYSLFIMTGTK